MLDADACYRALAAHDARFDGLFYVAVSTTGIYCRPVCRARTPRRDRCTFYRLAVEAERAGYRACFRCRPELAPGGAPVDAVPLLVARALSHIEEGYLNEHSIEELAGECGVSSRHLRRAVEEELGVAPVELAQSRRLSLAKQLLQDSSLPLADIALSSGFRSVRRFNALFQARFGRPPSAIRREHGDSSSPRAIRVRLDFRPPLDWDALLRFLEARSIPGVESVVKGEYRRTVRLGAKVGTVVVRRHPDRPAVIADVSFSLGSELMQIASRLRALLDLDAEPEVVAGHLRRDGRLRPLIARSPGLRVPGAFDTFEIVVRAVLGQRVSVRAATVFAGRLAGRFGTALPNEGGPRSLTHVFPAPRSLAERGADEIASIGLPRARAETILAVARGFATGSMALRRGDDVAEAMRRLEELPGIGPWTAQYVAMRALRFPDAFPASDLGVRKALGGVTAAGATRLSEPWRPWRSYAVMHLWSSLSTGEKK